MVDRLLTGFDAPCMSTIFIDRQPMGPHDLIQAFSRTNRIFDKNKVYGQIVTFQAPVLFKECVDNAVKLYSAGGTKEALVAEWEEVEPAFRKALSALRVSASSPADIPSMSLKEKEVFAKIFQNFDRLFAQLKSFTNYNDDMLDEYGITEEEYVEELRKENPKIAEIMSNLIYEIELDEEKYRGQSILNIVENMKEECIEKVIAEFCLEWYAAKEDVMYAAMHYRNGEIPNESAIKATVDYTSYKKNQENAVPKFKYYARLMSELKKTLDEEIKPLVNH